MSQVTKSLPKSLAKVYLQGALLLVAGPGASRARKSEVVAAVLAMLSPTGFTWADVIAMFADHKDGALADGRIGCPEVPGYCWVRAKKEYRNFLLYPAGDPTADPARRIAAKHFLDLEEKLARAAKQPAPVPLYQPESVELF